jgi:hypothetical protein
MSKYFITLNTVMKTGTIRYQYMGQDVRYDIRKIEINGSTISGRADFQSSLTGEVRGSPIVFNYDNADDIFKDGGTLSKCQNRQGNVPGE